MNYRWFLLLIFPFVYLSGWIAAGEKPVVVIIASYNNEDWCEKNLRSVFEQKYQNYRVIYIDDASTDRTLDKVKEFVRSARQEHRFTLIHNETNRKPAENYYRAIHSCQDDEIAVICDGDDWFLHEWVLERLNQEYADPEVWMTYGSYFYYPTFKWGECSKRLPKKVIESNLLREHLQKKGFILSHLKTFYAGLFKRIKLEDFLYEGQFMKASWDAAAMVPMMEMARSHAHFIKQPLYVNNRVNVLNEDRVRFNLQQQCWEHVKKGKAYEPINHWKREGKSEAECIIFSFNRPLQLYALLESMQAHVKGLSRTCVIYRVGNSAFDQAYNRVIKDFPDVAFMKQGSEPEVDFKPLLLKELHESPADYVMFAVDDMVVKDLIDCSSAIVALHKTGAEGFFFRLGTHITYCYAMDVKHRIPEGIVLPGGILAWQFSRGEESWKYPHSVDMTLYKKSEFLPLFEKRNYIHPGKLEEKWAGKPDFKRVGLCYETARVVNIPLNLVLPSNNRVMKSYTPEELLTLFEKGMKMDISPLFQIINSSPHIEYEPTFIMR